MHGKTAALVAIAMMSVSVGALWAPAAADASSDPNFVDVHEAAGLDFTCQHWGKWLGLGPRWFNDVFFCGSPALGDFNGDGFTDIYFPNTRYSTRYNAYWLNDVLNPQDALFLNNGDGTFTDATAFVGIQDKGYSMAASAVDLEGDGDLDVYVSNFREIPNAFNTINSPATTVYVNNGDGSFSLQSPTALGLVTETRCINPVPCMPDSQWGAAIAAADYDKDGCIDLYRGNYAAYRMNSGMPSGLQATLPDTNNLYHGDCDGTFTDVTADAGASLYAGRTFAVNFADLDNDHWADLYVANDENPNEVYLNNHDGTFADFSAGSGATSNRGSMCSTPADFNGDGNLDLFISNFESELDSYFLGNGDGTFASADTLGDLDVGFNYLGWACPAFDMDNDGDLDLFVANGHMEPAGGNFVNPDDPEDDNGYELPNHLFKNTLRETGVHSWQDMRASAGPGLLDRFVSSGAKAADFDLDGSLELVVVENNNQPTHLYKNTGPQGHWLQVELRSPTQNTHGIGARVEVTADGVTQMQQMVTGDTLGSGSAAPLHFGLGASTGPASVTVTWPSGLVQTETVGVDAPVRILEGAGHALDTLAPRVSIDAAGTPGANGWWTSPTLTVTLSATDAAFGQDNGVASLTYKLDGGAVQAYTGPFDISGDGYHKLTVYASDGAGNAAWTPREFRIDSVAPSMGVSEPVQGKLYVQDRLVGDSPTGDTLIVAPLRTPDTYLQLADQTYNGLRISLQAVYGIALPAAPASAAGTSASTVGSDGLTRVVLACADATSGTAFADLLLDGQAQARLATTPYAWDVDLRGLPAGEHSLTSVVTDRAGWSTSQSIRVLVVPTTPDGVGNTVFLGPQLPGGA